MSDETKEKRGILGSGFYPIVMVAIVLIAFGVGMVAGINMGIEKGKRRAKASGTAVPTTIDLRGAIIDSEVQTSGDVVSTAEEVQALTMRALAKLTDEIRDLRARLDRLRDVFVPHVDPGPGDDE